MSPIEAIRFALRSLEERPVASLLTGLSIALGVALAVVVMLLERQARGAFEGTAIGVEVLVAGDKGSRIDAVLGTLFHVGRAPGRVSLRYAESLAADDRVAYAIPVAVGDSYRGAPVVGTTVEFFTRFAPRPGLSFGVEPSALGPGTAVAGSEAARRCGLRVGDEFFPSHTGLEGDHTHRHERFRVAAVARPTGTAHDRAIYVDLEDFLHLKGHEGLDREEGGGEAVSAVLLKTAAASPLVVEPLLKEINDGTEAQAIRPMQVVAELFELVGEAQRILGWVAALVVAVAALSVSVAITSAMAGRRREIALFRAVGAPRGAVFAMVLCEAALLCLFGCLAGIALGHGGAALAAPLVEARTGVRLPGFLWLGVEPWLLLALTGAGCVAGLLPALHAYRVEVARGLNASAG
ncbi:MAG: ABC transporter permease [Planctomycetaceae bacterium]